MNNKISTVMNVNNKVLLIFYCLWKELSNENFKLAESRKFKNDSSSQSFTMTPRIYYSNKNSYVFL